MSVSFLEAFFGELQQPDDDRLYSVHSVAAYKESNYRYKVRLPDAIATGIAYTQLLYQLISDKSYKLQH